MKLGDRVQSNDTVPFFGTVKFVGDVRLANGSLKPFVGVEWDVAGKGKYDGTYEGVRYFEQSADADAAGESRCSFIKRRLLAPAVTLDGAIVERYMGSMCFPRK
jgi:dynactin complex subunit